MASLIASIAVFLAVLSFSSALSIPAFCNSCKTNVEDPYCKYCCTIFSCCNEGKQMEQCTVIECGCKRSTTSAPTSVTSQQPVTTATPTPKPRECKLPTASASRILDGKPIDVCKQPWMVHFSVAFQGVRGEPLPSCSGVLISQTQILTTSTCIMKINITVPMMKITVVAQFADAKRYLETQREIHMEQVLEDGDIAIVNFSPKVQVDEGESCDYCIRPVCLPDANTVFTEDTKQKCKTASWGLSDPVKGTIPKELQESDVTLMCSDVCKVLLPILESNGMKIDNPADGGLCSSPKTTQSSNCEMDQGGMLLCQDQGETTVENWMLAGIAYGTPCDVKKPSTFVNVTKNLEFINANLKWP